MSKDKSHSSGRIAENRKARYEYSLEDHYEAGIVLEGWEVKSLRAGKGNISDAYVLFKDGEPWLLGAHIIPLNTACTHVVCDPTRTRKLLLHDREIAKLQQAVSAKGYTVVPLTLHWKNNHIKCDIASARGKQLHDKRDSEKQRDWQREKQRVMARG